MTSTIATSSALFPSRLGLGLAALGRPGYINLGHATDLGQHYDVAALQAHAAAVLDVAWANGVRYFDAARSYGRAEAFLQHWLTSRAIDPATVSVGSKWGYTYTAGWQVHAEHHEIKEHSLAKFTEQWAETHQHLGPYLRLYQIHSATLESGVLTNQPVLTALAQLRAEHGVAIGLSLSGAAQAATLEQALAVTVEGVRLFDVVQATWNLLERSVGPLLAAAQQAGLRVIVKEALANGRLTARNLAPAFAPQLALLQREAARLQTTVDALALAAVLHQPWVAVVLSGAATAEQLTANLAALHVAYDDQAAQTLTALTESPAHYWATRSALAWN
ncbi:MAG: aldo/keto reductase [Caldilineaceae bacterium]|nr:aldo/keto reductase [Caldilineaceae bacterium]MCB0186411.1 aldo/keto reductase [Caldilineaceae bacterium]